MIFLYHFTALRFKKNIEKHGLRIGGIPQTVVPPRIDWGWVWLTQSPDFKQSWNSMFMIKYDRAAVRFDVAIPDSEKGNLVKWTDGGKLLTEPATYRDLTRFGDPENWFVFRGKIPPSWFVSISLKSEVESPGGVTGDDTRAPSSIWVRDTARLL